MNKLCFLMIMLCMPFIANAFIRIISYKWVTNVIKNVCAILILVTAFSMILDLVIGNSIRNDFLLLIMSFIIFCESAVFNVIIKKKCYL